MNKIHKISWIFIMILLLCFTFQIAYAEKCNEEKLKKLEKGRGDSSQWTQKTWSEVWPVLDSGGWDALACWCEDHGESNCCQKGGGDRCDCRCNITYCTYDKNGEGKCNGLVRAKKCTVLTGNSYTNCAVACRFCIPSLTEESYKTGSADYLYCGFGEEKHKGGTFQDNLWGAFGKAYCRAMGNCAGLQFQYVQSHKLKFCFTDADCKTSPSTTSTSTSTTTSTTTTTTKPPTYHVCDTNYVTYEGKSYGKCLEKPGRGDNECLANLNKSVIIGYKWVTTKTFPFLQRVPIYATINSFCEKKPTPVQHWKCLDPLKQQCVRDDSGTYLSEDSCKFSCFVARWVCNTWTGSCEKKDVKTLDGSYENQDECNQICKASIPIRYSCDTRTGKCQEDRYGSYSSLSSCQKECKKDTSPHLDYCDVSLYRIIPRGIGLDWKRGLRGYWSTFACKRCEAFILPIEYTDEDRDFVPLKDENGKDLDYISMGEVPTSVDQWFVDNRFILSLEPDELFPSNRYYPLKFIEKRGDYLYKIKCEGTHHDTDEEILHIRIYPILIWYEVPGVMPARFKIQK